MTRTTELFMKADGLRSYLNFEMPNNDDQSEKMVV
ncbi:MAG: hypothetical protein ACI8UO_004510 [Verrucomicrobiales bacterium]|jgi:hypothetical protein